MRKCPRCGDGFAPGTATQRYCGRCATEVGILVAGKVRRS